MCKQFFKDARKRSGSFQNESCSILPKDASDSAYIYVFKLGICAMECKVSGSPMQSILKRLARSPEFEIVQFPESMILHEPITTWPVVDCLIAFHSTGYPFDKVREYVNWIKPVILNDLDGMRCLRSRAHVLRNLKENNVPTPSHIVVDHLLCGQGRSDHVFEEHYDYIVYNGLRLNKPFVEKPLDADNHNNYVYYPRNTGGGCKKLFRKVKDRSSLFYPEYHEVRRDGTYVYEEFLATFGTDVKVYTVGSFFAHAEARKSPTLDGKVQRTPHGKEVRYPVILTENEKVMAYKIVEIFKQVICGFDILRTTSGSSYICDVNGWSFVKGNVKYYNDCAHIMRILFLTKLQKKFNFIPRELREGELSIEAEEDTLRKTFIEVDDSVIHPNKADEELRAMIVVMRHGDRQPKQKLKFETSEPEILEYHENLDPTLVQKPWVSADQLRQVKLKSPEELQGLLEKSRIIIKRLGSQLHHDPSLRACFENFSLLQRVLERGDGFAGINRKLQIKPVSWTVTVDESGKEKFTVKKQLIVAKWGGELTSVGRAQAEDLGRRLRAAMYPGDAKGGLLRLHSTFRHDLKIYTSDEGRCQVTSAAFTKGFLDLEGQLTPILVQMVVRNAKAHNLLDSSPTSAKQRDLCKKLLDQLFNSDFGLEEMTFEHKQWIINATGYSIAAPFLVRPKETMMTILTLIQKLVDALSYEIQRFETATGPQNDFFTVFEKDLSVTRDPDLPQTDALRQLCSRTKCSCSAKGYGLFDVSLSTPNSLCSTESSMCHSCRLIFLLSDRLRDIRYRWEQLQNSWYNTTQQRFDSSKLPDIVDNLRYDLIHNHMYIGTAALQAAFSIYTYVEPLVHFVSPAEYGLTAQQKIDIGLCLIPKLLKKIIADITFSRETNDVTSSEHQSEVVPSDSLRRSSTTVKERTWVSKPLNQTIQETSTAWSSHGVTEEQTISSSTKLHHHHHFTPQHLTQLHCGGNPDGPTTMANPDATPPTFKTQTKPMDSADTTSSNSTFNQTVVINTDSLWGHQKPPKNSLHGGLVNTVTSEQLKHSLTETKYMSLPSYSPTSSSPNYKDNEPQSRTQRSSMEVAITSEHMPTPLNCKTPTEFIKETDSERTDERLNLLDEDEHDDTQSHFRLKEKEAIEMGIKSPWRIVRSRYYVASASHIFSLFNILLYGSNHLHHQYDQETTQDKLIDEDALDTARNVTDIHYLSHIVLRVWEKRGVESQDARRFRLEIQFSTGTKDGFGGNYQLLRQHAQGKQAVFQKHLEHLLTHHSQRKSNLNSDDDGSNFQDAKANPFHESDSQGPDSTLSSLTPTKKQTIAANVVEPQHLNDEESLCYASDFEKAYPTESGSQQKPPGLYKPEEKKELSIAEYIVPPYCEINPLHRLTRNGLVETLEKMVFNLLGQAKVVRPPPPHNRSA